MMRLTVEVFFVLSRAPSAAQVPSAGLFSLVIFSHQLWAWENLWKYYLI